MAQCTVRLTTTECSSPVAVHLFQFGTVPASPGSWALVVDSVEPGTVGEPVFWVNSEVPVPAEQEVRFNLRFQLNVHNSANLQLRLRPTGSSSTMDWRWSAPIGWTGTWGVDVQHAPWSDDEMEYSLTIEPDGPDVAVTLSEHQAPSRE